MRVRHTPQTLLRPINRCSAHRCYSLPTLNECSLRANDALMHAYHFHARMIDNLVSKVYQAILSRGGVIIDGVWIGDEIYRT
jgi:hypothetical protein